MSEIPNSQEEMNSQGDQPPTIHPDELQINNNDHRTRQNLKFYVEWFINLVDERQYTDDDLWEEFHVEFTDWNIEAFELAGRETCRTLRDQMRSRGVNCRMERRYLLPKQLHILLLQDEPTTWTQEEVDQQAQRKGEGLVSTVLKPKTDRPSTQRPTTPNTRPPTRPPTRPTTPTNPNPNPNRPPTRPPTRPNSPTNNTQPSGQNLSHCLTNLKRGYEDEGKYQGRKDPATLRAKLPQFKLNCKTAGIKEEHYADAFHIMLKGDAKQFYLDELDGKGYSFEELCNRISSRYETRESVATNQTLWNHITFRDFMKKQEIRTLSLPDQFDEYVSELRQLQRKLPPEFQTDHIIRNHLLTTTRDIKACASANASKANTLDELESEIKSSILTQLTQEEAERREQAQGSFNQYDFQVPYDPYQNPDQVPPSNQLLLEYPAPDTSFQDLIGQQQQQQYDDQFLTDRGFRRPNYPPNYSAHYPPRPSYPPQTNYPPRMGTMMRPPMMRPPLNPYTTPHSRQPQGQSPQQQRFPGHSNWQKMCNVCGRSGCWSTNHPPQERVRARQSLRQRIPNGTMYSESLIDQFVLEYEGAPPPENGEYQHLQADLRQLNTTGQPITTSSTFDPPPNTYRQHFMTTEPTEDTPMTIHGSFVNTSMDVGLLEAQQTLQCLQEAAMQHRITKEVPTVTAYLANHRYSDEIFEGILCDTGAAGVSSGGEHQFRAYQKLTGAKLDESKKGKARIIFGDSDVKTSYGTVIVPTPAGKIEFHILPGYLPFIWAVKDMTRMKCIVNNVDDVIEQKVTPHQWAKIPIVWKNGHPFMSLNIHQAMTSTFHRVYFGEDPNSPEEIELYGCHLTEKELRQLHRRFGHPSARRLENVLNRANQDFDRDVIQKLTEFCKHCQLHGKSPGRFRFVLRSDHEFNHVVILDIMHLDGEPVLHVVDDATSFNAAEFLDEGDHPQSAICVWNAFRKCYMDVFIGPPDYIVIDAASNFGATEFKQLCGTMSIDIKEVPIEAHNSVGKVERYHMELRRAYEVISESLEGLNVPKKLRLQMAVKAVNDTAGPDGLIPTLLVFGAFPRMTHLDPPAPSVVQRAKAIKNAMTELRRVKACRDVAAAKNMRNGPTPLNLVDVPIGSKVRVHRENIGWLGPYTLLGIEGQTCLVDLRGKFGPRNIRAINVKPWKDEDEEAADGAQHSECSSSDDSSDDDSDNEGPAPPRRGRPRKRGSPINKKGGKRRIAGRRRSQREFVSPTRLRRSQRQRQQPLRYRQYFTDADFATDKLIFKFGTDENSFTVFTASNDEVTDTFFAHDNFEDFQDFQQMLMINASEFAYVTAREEEAIELSKKLRAQGIIKTPGAPFEASTDKEITGLQDRQVIRFVKFDPATMSGVRVFGSRLVHELKGTLEEPIEKTRLVIQAYHDQGKKDVLTQSPTLQRSSLRIILALAPALLALDPKYMVWLLDVIQAYCQSEDFLARFFIARIPHELRHKYPPDFVMWIPKCLYGIPEAGTYWYKTYKRYHVERLQMECSTYDACLMHTTKGPFGLVGLQTDDSFCIGEKEFQKDQKTQLDEAKIEAKPIEKLTVDSPIIFNGTKTTLEQDGSIYLAPRGQADKIKLIDIKHPDYQSHYVEQRARAAYLSSICQPRTAYDTSVAAQHQDPKEPEVNALNECLKWIQGNPTKGLRYIALDLDALNLYTFTDGSLANNPDLSSQIGFYMVLGNERPGKEPGEVIIRGNTVAYTSVKCRRIVRSILGSECYSTVLGADLAVAILTTLNKIIEQLGCKDIRNVILTDSNSLFQCLTKLGTTVEKRLMIDIMALREAYERREITELRRIRGSENLSDRMTKKNGNDVLDSFVETNEITIHMDEWVERPERASSDRGKDIDNDNKWVVDICEDGG